MMIFLITTMIIALIGVVVFISIKVLKILITHFNTSKNEGIQNTDIQKTKIKDL